MAKLLATSVVPAIVPAFSGNARREEEGMRARQQADRFTPTLPALAGEQIRIKSGAIL
jgi:hypothetical protein